MYKAKQWLLRCGTINSDNRRKRVLIYTTNTKHSPILHMIWTTERGINCSSMLGMSYDQVSATSGIPLFASLVLITIISWFGWLLISVSIFRLYLFGEYIFIILWILGSTTPSTFRWFKCNTDICRICEGFVLYDCALLCIDGIVLFFFQYKNEWNIQSLILCIFSIHIFWLVSEVSYIPYIVWTRQKKKNKCTYSVECRRDSPPDDDTTDSDDSDDDDDSSSDEKNRKLCCLLQLLLLSAVLLHIPTTDNVEEVCSICRWWFSRIIDGRRSNDRIIVWEMMKSSLSNQM